MNTGTWTLIAWLCILGFVPVGTYLGWHYGRIEGRHEGRCAEKERELARRHRAELRTPYEGPEIRAKTGPLDLPSWQDFLKQEGNSPRPDLTPVIVPEPGTHKPQPGGTGPLTTTMPKLTDTGEIRAINERGAAIRAAMLTGEAAWQAKADS